MWSLHRLALILLCCCQLSLLQNPSSAPSASSSAFEHQINMSFVTLGGDASQRPTFFEMVAAERLGPSLKAAVAYSLSVRAPPGRAPGSDPATGPRRETNP